MNTRTVWITVTLVAVLAACVSTTSTASVVDAVKSTSQIAARYHLRTRTSNFFKRAGSGRSTGHGLFGR